MLPSDLTLISITDTYSDMAGNPVGGSVSFVPTSQLTDATGNVVFPQQPVVVGVSKSTGTFTVKLPCTDNSGLAPSSWAYTVEISVQGMDPTPFNVLLPSTLGSSVQLRTVAPAVPPAPPMGTAVYSVNGLSGAVEITATSLGAISSSALTAETARAETAEAALAASVPSGSAPVPIGSGGTGHITQGAALTALTGTQAAGEYVRSDGTNAALAALQAADLTGSVGISQGGTGSGTRNFAGLLTQTAAKTSAYTAAAGDFVCVDTTSGAVTITLPNAPADLTVVAVKMVASATPANAVTIVRNPSGTDVFNVSGGSTSATLTLLEQSSVFQYQHSAGIWLKQTGDVPLAQADLRYRRSVSIAEYGATTGASDNGSAINAAITALGSAGGIVYIPPGSFQFSTQLSLASAKSVTFTGQTNPGGGATMPSQLVWTGTGSGSAINAQNSSGIVFRNVAILYTSASFTGNLLDYRNVSGSDTSYGLLENCYLGSSPSTVTTANALVNLDKCINMTIRKCNIAGAVYGIYGKSLNTTYSNVVLIQDCVFSGQSSFHIYNAGQSWVIDNCTFEQLAGGTAGAYGHDSGNLMDTVSFRGCWTGDSTGGTQFTVAGTSVSLLGNWIGAGSGTAIYTDEVVNGLVVTGNDFVDCSVALETVQPSGASGARAWVIAGNAYTGVTTRLSGNFAAGTLYHDGQSQGTGTGLAVYGLNVNGDLSLQSGDNITLGTGTGTKLGTGTTQKLGFWNATPIVQPTVTGSAIGTSLSSLLTALSGAGLIANSTSVPADLILDSTASDIVAAGTQAAGSTGKIADAGHVHPFSGSEMPSDRGFLAWTFCPENITQEIALSTFTTGNISLTKVWLRKPVTVSTISLAIGNAVGSALTASECFAGLYDSGGTLRGTTADQSTAWTTAGNANTTLAMSLTSSYAAPAGFYWIALLYNGTTGPKVCTSVGSNSSGPNFGLTVSTAYAGFITGSNTSLPGTITPSAIHVGFGGSFPILAGLS